MSAILRRDSLKLRKDDLYETPPEAVEALLRVEDVPTLVWEPACGPGAIARVLRAHGRHVIATDLVDYGSPDQDHTRRDFLMERSAPGGCQCILTNPPFKLAGKFVEHALELCPRVIMLLRLAFVESTGRSHILDCGRLARVLVFRNRLRMKHRADWEGPRTEASALPFAWFVWDREHRGDTTIRRISWEARP